MLILSAAYPWRRRNLSLVVESKRECLVVAARAVTRHGSLADAGLEAATRLDSSSSGIAAVSPAQSRWPLARFLLATERAGSYAISATWVPRGAGRSSSGESATLVLRSSRLRMSSQCASVRTFRHRWSVLLESAPVVGLRVTTVPV